MSSDGSSSVPKVPLRAWCFTINNYTQADIDAVLALQTEAVLRLAVGKEVAPTTGTPHLQGYVRFRKSARFQQVKQWLGGRANLRPRNGTETQASKYALKDKDVLVDYGVDFISKFESAEGSSSRCAGKRVIEMIDAGATPREIWEENRVYFMYNSRRIYDEYKRARWYRDNPGETGFWPGDGGERSL